MLDRNFLLTFRHKASIILTKGGANMKNFMCLCLSLLLIFALCGCETEEEKEAKEAAKDAERLKEQYYNALEEYNDLKNDINTYYNNQNKLGY